MSKYNYMNIKATIKKIRNEIDDSRAEKTENFMHLAICFCICDHAVRQKEVSFIKLHQNENPTVAAVGVFLDLWLSRPRLVVVILSVFYSV